jgi:hypothetical protein
MKWYFRTDVTEIVIPGYSPYRKLPTDERLVIDSNDPHLDWMINQTGNAATNPAQAPLTYEEQMSVKDQPKHEREVLGDLLAELISERTVQDIRQQRRGRLNRVNVG